MAIGTTLPIENLWDRIRIQDAPFRLERYEETSGTGRGEILVSEFAPAKWRGEVRLAPIRTSLAGELQATLEVLEGGVRFFLHSSRNPYPISDPNGNVIRNWSTLMTIQDTKVDNKTMRLTGLPANYKLSVGDMLAFNLGDGRRALHRIAEGAVASGTGGLTAYFEVRPHFRPGTLVGTPVSLRKPTAKMMIFPGSVEIGTAQGPWTVGMAFSTIEVF